MWWRNTALSLALNQLSVNNSLIGSLQLSSYHLPINFKLFGLIKSHLIVFQIQGIERDFITRPSQMVGAFGFLLGPILSFFTGFTVYQQWRFTTYPHPLPQGGYCGAMGHSFYWCIIAIQCYCSTGEFLPFLNFPMLCMDLPKYRFCRRKGR